MGLGDFGFSSVNSLLNPNKNNEFTTNLASKLNTLLISGRVKSIVLNNFHPRFEELGGWTAIGAVEYEPINIPILSTSKFPVAYPININNKYFPLLNEIIIILPLTDTNIETTNTSKKSYYLHSIGLWNHPHHNAYPLNSNKVQPSQNKSYNQTQVGSTSKPTDEPVQINLGNTFIEKPNIHSLLPFEGDVILEGRWGNSIRFGSTVKDTFNNWSFTGSNGDPITIIRNGQGTQTDEGWIPTTENINNDETSIYLTSTQQISLDASSVDYTSYFSNKKPITPSKFTGAQILLNSGRLVFNTNKDHILLSSAKSINLNSKESINIDTIETSIQSNIIYLGKYKAEEPLMLGKQTVDLLKSLVQSLTTFMNVASIATTNICVPGAAATLPTINIAAQSVLDDLNNLNKLLGVSSNLQDCKITSKRNFTV